MSGIITSSNNDGVLANPPQCNGSGGQKGAMFLMKFEAFLAAKGLSKVNATRFDRTLPATEATTLTTGTDDVVIEAVKSNQLAMTYLTMSMKTPEMLNMISLEKQQDADWPTGKFSNIYKLIKE